MEELRAYLGDRLVLSLINRKQITIKDFMPCVGDYVVINNLTYKIKSRVFKCQGKTVKVVLKKVDNENTNS